MQQLQVSKLHQVCKVHQNLELEEESNSQVLVACNFDSKCQKVFDAALPMFACSSHSLDTPVSSPFHNELFVNAGIVQSGCSGCPQRVVRLESFDTSSLTESSHGQTEVVVPYWYSIIPAIRCWLACRF